MGKARRVADDDANTRTSIAPRTQLFDASLIHHGRGSLPIFTEQFSEVAAVAQGSRQDLFDNITFQKRSGGHRRSVPWTFVPLRRRRDASPPSIVVLTFGLLGAFWGLWAMALPDIQHSFNLSNSALGVVLAVAVGVAGFAGAIVGRLARHIPSLHLLAGVVLVWAVTSVPPSLTHSVVPFALLFGVAQITAGCVDAAMNAPATVFFGNRSGALVRFHSLFNLGALVGAAAGAAGLASGVSWRWLWPALAVVSVVIALLALGGSPGSIIDAQHRPHAPSLVTVGESSPAPPAKRRTLRQDGLLSFLLIFALAEVTEGGAFTWGVLYLRHFLRAGVLVGAGAYLIGHGVAALARALGGSALRHTPVAKAFVLGSTVCAAGLLLETATTTTWIAAVGLALATAGTSLFWPLAMSTVAERSSSPGQAVGSFTAAGYVGWVAGAPVIGTLSDLYGARAGLLSMALICVVVIGAVLRGVVPSGPKNSSLGPVG